MPEVDFVMTYPCYFLHNASGNPEVVTIDGNACLCLFTDQDLVERFYKHHYGTNYVTRTIETSRVDTQPNLIALLKAWKAEYGEQGCRHIAIDATPNRQVGYVEFGELIAELVRQESRV